MNTDEIYKDLKKALEKLDKNNYVLLSTITHLEEQCTDEEVKIIEDGIYKLDIVEYDGRKEFYEDYQPIFDLVDWSLKEVFITMDRRSLNLNAL